MLEKIMGTLNGAHSRGFWRIIESEGIAFGIAMNGRGSLLVASTNKYDTESFCVVVDVTAQRGNRWQSVFVNGVPRTPSLQQEEKLRRVAEELWDEYSHNSAGHEWGPAPRSPRWEW